MDKKLKYLLVIFVLLTGVMILQNSHNKNTDYINAVASDEAINFGNISSVEAIYYDSSSTLNEMKKNSELIVQGITKDTQQFSEIAVISELVITDVTKGNKKLGDKILVRQIGKVDDDNVLKRDNEYILFLKPNSYDESYYISGGFDGFFTVNDNKVEPYLYKWDSELLENKRDLNMTGNKQQYEIKQFKNTIQNLK